MRSFLDSINRKFFSTAILRLCRPLRIASFHGYFLHNTETCLHTDTSKNHGKKILRALRKKLYQFDERYLFFEIP